MLMFSDIESGANPGQLSGLKAWYDASRTQLGTLASLPDFSGNNNTATQVSLALQPTNTASQINGENAILFGGSQYMILPSALYSISNGSNTIFAVAKRNTETGLAEDIVIADTGGTANYYLQFRTTASEIGFKNRDVAGGSVNLGGIVNTNYNILCAYRTGTTLAISSNNGAFTTAATAADIIPTNMYIGAFQGASEFLIGGIAEIIMYNRALSAAEIAQVNRYLSNKYAITIS